MNYKSSTRPFHRVEKMLGNLLRFGVLAAGIVVFVGGIIYIIRYGTAVPQYAKFKGEPENLRHVISIITSALSLKGEAIIQLGFLILIATPIARVIFSVYAFAREHDFVYVIVTLIVLGVLIFGFAGGHL